MESKILTNKVGWKHCTLTSNEPQVVWRQILCLKRDYLFFCMVGMVFTPMVTFWGQYSFEFWSFRKYIKLVSSVSDFGIQGEEARGWKYIIIMLTPSGVQEALWAPGQNACLSKDRTHFSVKRINKRFNILYKSSTLFYKKKLPKR